jgi:hypothetical protein
MIIIIIIIIMAELIHRFGFHCIAKNYIEGQLKD